MKRASPAWKILTGLAAGGLLVIGGARWAVTQEGRSAPVRAAARPVELADGPLYEALSGVDFIPARERLDAQLENAHEKLLQVSRPAEQTIDPGVRLRALQALAGYPGEQTERALKDTIAAHAGARTGVEVLFLRASVDALAQVAGIRAREVITPLLSHGSRDVRADAAHAMAVCGRGITSRDLLGLLLSPLRRRLLDENEPQVIGALEEAIRSLSPDTR